jgi:hypothetical protein
MLREGGVSVVWRWAMAGAVLACVMGAAKSKTAMQRPGVAAVIVATRPAVQRAEAPDVREQARAAREAREVFQKEYAATGAGARRALARKLLAQGVETANDPAARFVLFREARDLAAGAGDAAVACRAIELLDRYFAIDELAMTRETLARAAGARQGQGMGRGWGAIAFAANSAVRRAVMADDYETALRLLELAGNAARKSQDAELIRQAQERGREARWWAERFKQVKEAREVLKQKPEDGEGNLLAGSYLCFANGRFTDGLPLLLKGDNVALAGMAKAELAGDQEAEAQLQVASGWWEMAVNQPAIVQRNVQGHAAEIYRRLLPKLSGLNRSMAEKRLETLELEWMGERGLEPGLRADLFKGAEFSVWVRSRVDAKIDFEWGQDAPDEQLPKDDFSFRWSGFLRVPGAGRYELIVQANMGARLWIDGQLAVDGPNLSRSRNGARVPVEFSAGLHELRIEYWDTSGLARMRLLWKPPGGAEGVIPAESLWHDGMTDDE